MSIWADMLKYNARIRKFQIPSSSDKAETIIKEFNPLPSPSAEDVEFLKIVPKISGDLKVTITTKVVQKGTENSQFLLRFWNPKGDEVNYRLLLLQPTTEVGGTYRTTDELRDVKAFEPIFVTFRNYDVSSSKVLIVPQKMEIEYIVTNNKNEYLDIQQIN
jgi:hypothetical protein